MEKNTKERAEGRKGGRWQKRNWVRKRKRKEKRKLTFKKVGKNCCTIKFATFCVWDAIPTACARTFMEKTSDVQIQIVAPQEGL